MSTTRNIYLTISLPGQNLEKIMNDCGLEDFTLSKQKLLEQMGDKTISLDKFGNLETVYSASTVRYIWQLFDKTLEYRIANGIPIITIGSGLGRSDLRYFKKIDASFGYHIYLVDFIAPVLKKVCDEELIDRLEPRVKKIFSKRKLSNYLLRYRTVNWEELEWPILTPNEFFEKVTEKLIFKPINNPLPSAELLVIGDVHGDYEDLVEVLSDHPNADITLLGDYIDRGPQSGKVLRLLMERQNDLHLLSGNHEINLRKRFIEHRATFGRLQQATVNQLIAENFDENEIRDFLSKLDTYRAFRFGNKNFFLSHAGVEPVMVKSWMDEGRMELLSSEVFLYGVKSEGKSVYKRDVDIAWVENPIKDTVMIHGHRNQFNHLSITDDSLKVTSINLADSDTTTFRYAVVHMDNTVDLHVRQRFTKNERIMRENL